MSTPPVANPVAAQPCDETNCGHRLCACCYLCEPDCECLMRLAERVSLCAPPNVYACETHERGVIGRWQEEPS